MTFIYDVDKLEPKVRPTDPNGDLDTLTISFDGEIYLTGVSVKKAEALADLLLQAAMAMRLSGKE